MDWFKGKASAAFSKVSNLFDSDEFVDWLKVNKLSNIAGKLAARDIKQLSDLSCLVNKKDIEEFAAEMGLGVLPRTRFVEAVVKLNDKTNTNSNPNSNSNSNNYAPSEEVKQDMAGEQEGISPGGPGAWRGREKYAHFFHDNNIVRRLPLRDVSKPNKTIMVIGATGTGKTTVLNSMMNYLYDVQFTDKYRLRLIDEPVKVHGQATSQTDKVTPYYLEAPILDYNLTVIDTPGFGDSRGMQRDKQITRDIKTCFETEISEIDAICFVIRAPQARLEATQKYIFSQVLGIFGNDIKDNIFILLTFADSNDPPAIAALKAGKIPFKKYFKLNNSGFALANDNVDKQDATGDTFMQLFWAMGMGAFEKFFEELNITETKSLTLTKQVLSRRQKLELHIENINPVIQEGFDLLESMRSQILIIQRNEAIVDSSKNFTMKVSKTRREKQPIVGHYTTICDVCKWTCHPTCGIPNNADKSGCDAMNIDGYCTSCPNSCHWAKHTNESYIWIGVKYIEIQDIKDLKAKYMDSKSKMSATEQIITGMLGDVDLTENKLNVLIANVRGCLNELSKIALRPNVLTQDDYIDKLIKAEEDDKIIGWRKRIKALQSLKEKNKIVVDIQQSDYNPFECYSDVTKFITNSKINKKKSSASGFSFW